MNYLDRNIDMLSCIDPNKLIMGTKLGDSTFTIDRVTINTLVSNVGNFQHPTTHKKYEIAFREHQLDPPECSFSNILYFLNDFDKRFAHHSKMLPLFYGLVKDHEGNFIGTIMEDFTDNGTYRLRENVPHIIPRDLAHLDIGDAQKSFFQVRDRGLRTKIGDLDHITEAYFKHYSINPSIINLDREKHTIIVSSTFKPFFDQ